MIWLKVYRTGISRKTGRQGVDLQSGTKYDHVAVMPEDVVLVEDLQEVLKHRPDASLKEVVDGLAR